MEGIKVEIKEKIIRVCIYVLMLIIMFLIIKSCVPDGGCCICGVACKPFKSCCCACPPNPNSELCFHNPEHEDCKVGLEQQSNK